MAPTFEFDIRGVTFRLEDVGPALNAHFEQYYRQMLGEPSSFNQVAFMADAEVYFAANTGNFGAIDGYFNNFTPLWLNLLNRQWLVHAETLWRRVLRFTHDWEKRTGSKVHKGSPYYFLGMTSIRKGDLDSGFLQLHQALSEDIRIKHPHIPNTSGMRFSRLDPQNQPLYNDINDTLNLIRGLLATYNQQRNGNLSEQEFKAKFLHSVALQDAVFQFSFSAFRLCKLVKQIEPEFQQNPFAAQLQSTVLFDICVAIDEAIRTKNPKGKLFSDQVKYLGQKQGWKLANVSLQKELQGPFGQDQAKHLTELLDGTFRLTDGSQLNDIERDFAVAYAIRNFRAHSLASLEVVHKRFPDIVQSVLNCLFFSTEKEL